MTTSIGEYNLWIQDPSETEEPEQGFRILDIPVNPEAKEAVLRAIVKAASNLLDACYGRLGERLYIVGSDGTKFRVIREPAKLVSA
ncbi:MAG: hypothetical protein AAB861_00340 [Patescibacteria group bacterium]